MGDWFCEKEFMGDWFCEKESLWVTYTVKKIESWVADFAEEEQVIKVGRLFVEITEH